MPKVNYQSNISQMIYSVSFLHESETKKTKLKHKNIRKQLEISFTSCCFVTDRLFMKRGQTEKKTLSRKVDQTFTEHLKESRRVQEQKVRPDLNCPSQADGRGRTGRHVCDGRTGERKETETRGRRRVRQTAGQSNRQTDGRPREQNRLVGKDGGIESGRPTEPILSSVPSLKISLCI